MARIRSLLPLILLAATFLPAPAGAVGDPEEYPLRVAVEPAEFFPAPGETVTFSVTVKNPTSETVLVLIDNRYPGDGNAGIVSPEARDAEIPPGGSATRTFTLATPEKPPASGWSQLFMSAHDLKTDEKLGYAEAKVYHTALRMEFAEDATSLAPGESRDMDLILHNPNEHAVRTRIGYLTGHLTALTAEAAETMKEVTLASFETKRLAIRLSLDESATFTGSTKLGLTALSTSSLTPFAQATMQVHVPARETTDTDPVTPATLSTPTPAPTRREPESIAQSDLRPTPPPTPEETPTDARPGEKPAADETTAQSTPAPSPAPVALEWATLASAAEAAWTFARENAAAAVAIGATASLAALGAVLRWRENLRYGALAPILGLFTRLKAPEILNHPVRARLHQLILDNPGMSPAALKRETGLNGAALIHHLRTLERHRLVTSRKEGNFRCFYPVGARLPPVGPQPLPEAQQRILEFLMEGPQEQQTLAERLGLTRQGANYHVKTLQRKGLLEIRNQGGRWVCVTATASAPAPTGEAHSAVNPTR